MYVRYLIARVGTFNMLLPLLEQVGAPNTSLIGILEETEGTRMHTAQSSSKVLEDINFLEPEPKSGEPIRRLV